MIPRITCLLGIAVFIMIAWVISDNRRRFPWRTVIGGLFLQLTLAAIVLRTTSGQYAFEQLASIVDSMLACVNAGTDFVFGINAGDAGDSGDGGDAGDSDTPSALPRDSLVRTFAFGILPTIIFFSSLMSVLYHLRIMQWVVWAMALVMQRFLGTTGPETLSAAANVFVGHTEAPLVIKPYLATMSRSELNALMTGGFATVTGGLLGVYQGLGIALEHLLTASVISAPAALLIAKVIVPASSSPDEPQARSLQFNTERTSVNVIGAAAAGASDGLILALNVGAMLIAFLALIALVNAVLTWSLGITLQWILGYVFSPLAICMGIPLSEALQAGQFLGIKTVANEFVAFEALGKVEIDQAGQITSRTKTILTYALAGFSNFGAIGIQVGGIGALEPSRRDDLARLGMRAMFGGLLACCMTGAIAGLLL